MRHLHKYGYDIEGIEYDQNIVDKIQQEDNTLTVKQGDVTNLGYPDNYFDTLLCFGVIGGLEGNTAKAITELKRVLKPNGKIIISTMLDNYVRKVQKIISFTSKEKNNFYAWMDTQDGWQNYFSTFNLQVIDLNEVVSRYSIFYWAKFLQSSKKTNMTLARVNENEFKLNILGEIFWFIHKYIFRKQMAMGMTFVLKNNQAN